uniref:Uncharacterized protein n=1 Tax=Candidatus Methanogaster sp. ANME-2c ERB4 TaxID=2759911 RepID=A0A7G9YA90_9EURY|nr:hypothetical protein CMAMJACB_00003 [Methanosarcinales archaeon ANME-2c ERB4]
MNSAEKKQQMIPTRQSSPKSLIIGTVEVNRLTKPSPVMISAIITAGAVCRTVSETAFFASPLLANSSSMRLWNWIA